MTSANFDTCYNCGKDLDSDEQICLGMYATRGCYCSHLCSYIKQPTWCNQEKAAEELKAEFTDNHATFDLDNGEEALYVYRLVSSKTSFVIHRFIVEHTEDGVKAAITIDQTADGNSGQEASAIPGREDRGDPLERNL